VTARDACIESACTSPAHARGLCNAHYALRRREGMLPPRPTTEDDLWAKAARNVPEGDCWEWLGVINASGYGTFKRSGSRYMAHRWTYEQLVGPIPEGLTIDHLCRNRSCVNPVHMEPVTRGENTIRGGGTYVAAAIKRAQTNCKHGHEYTTENTYIDPKTDRRSCRTCRSVQSRKSNQKEAA
jgi:hypothetical protein